jgi:translation initiation factor 2A
MPAKATIYNLKTEAVFDFGTGPRNFSFYNPQGNNILFAVSFVKTRDIIR